MNIVTGIQGAKPRETYVNTASASMPTETGIFARSIIIAAFACMASAFSSDAEAQQRPLAELPVPVIRVSGEGQAYLAPDMAVITLGVLREADTARAALDANNKAMADVITAMKNEGIEQRDLQTSAFSIQPRYVYPKPDRNGQQEAPRITGYTATNQLTVRIRDLSRLGAILDKAISLGVNNDGNISFTNDDPSAAISSARTEAMKDARARAETLAKAAGVSLGPILEISESFSRPGPAPIARSMKAREFAAEAVPVATGENSYSVTVQAAWQIETP